MIQRHLRFLFAAFPAWLRPRVASFLAMLVLLGCAVPPADEAVTKRNSQLALEMKVKGALVAEPSLAAAAIEVTSSDHTVTLGGFVETQTQRQRAAEVAHEVAGVKKIVNNITVK